MFKSIKATNLFSWENLNYDVQTGISQITGFNFDDNTSEGSGKSSIPNILCWVLYGSIPKDARVDEVVREGSKGGSGTVVLDDGSSVVRSRHPNDLYLLTANGQTLKGKDAKETQELINKLVGLNFDAFCQTIYFAQSYPNKFVAASEVDKVKILSEVQDLTVFDKARKSVQNKIKDEDAIVDALNKVLTANEAESSKIQSNIQLLVQFVEKFEKDKDQKVEILESRVKELDQMIKKLLMTSESEKKDAFEIEIERIEELLQTLQEKKIKASGELNSVSSLIKLRDMYSLKYNKSIEQITRLKGRLKIATADLAKLVKSETFAPGNCPTCGQSATEATLKEHAAEVEQQIHQATSEIVSMEEELVELQRESEEAKKSWEDAKIPDTDKANKLLKDVDKEARELATTKRNCQRELGFIELSQQELSRTNKQRQTLIQDLAVLKATDCTEQLKSLENLDEKLTTLTKKNKKDEKQLATVLTKRNNLEILKTGFKEVKQYVFQSLLAELSAKSTSLASELFEVPILIKFSNEDEDGGLAKIKTLVTLNGSERSLGLYSGGQYRRIELAVDLALASIVANRSHNPIKLRILDEPMKDLSETSMQKVITLLERLEGSTILIEHNSIASSIVHSTFNIEYRDGVSSVA